MTPLLEEIVKVGVFQLEFLEKWWSNQSKFSLKLKPVDWSFKPVHNNCLDFY